MSALRRSSLARTLQAVTALSDAINTNGLLPREGMQAVGLVGSRPTLEHQHGQHDDTA